MNIEAFLSFAAAVICSGLAAFVLIWGKRSVAHMTFVIGMIALAADRMLTGLSAEVALPSADFIRLQHLRLVALALIPGSWLLFSLSFARENYREFVGKWKWVVLAAFALPLTLVGLFSDSFFKGMPSLDSSLRWTLALGWSGYIFYCFLLICSVLILMNLEMTLKASTGSKRWQIKFMVLGLGGLFAAYIYTSSQILLFSSFNIAAESINSYAVIVVGILMGLSWARSRLLNVEIYLSRGMLYNSVTVLFAGTYLLVVGFLAKAVSYFGNTQILPLATFFVFLALVGLAVFLLSDQLQQEVKRFIDHHFHRPRHDYRKVWAMFTKRTTFLVDIKDICEAVSKMVSETFGVPEVTIWCLDEKQERVTLGGSTEFFETQAFNFKLGGNDLADLIRVMRDQQNPVDFEYVQSDFARNLKQPNADAFRRAGIRYCAPLVSGGEFLGFMTLGAKLTNEPFSLEDLDLLKVIADQTAGSLFTLKLSERLMQRKEMEAFQAVSAFFVHDLKNLASRLSLTMQNLSTHFANPEFRKDAMAMISDSVSKINTMCIPLSLVSKKPEFRKTKADLNQLVTSTIAGLNGCLKASLTQEAHRVVPKIYMDPDQVQKVIVNLIFNANEAVGEGGEIRVTTDRSDGWALVTVSDNGCGMSKDFIAHSLFQPFQTTKKQGSGIGLFHSKIIVQAHQGRIEVESEEGKGSTFRVMLPVDGEKTA